MHQCVIISDIKPASLQIVHNLAMKNPDTELYLLSDAVFMLSDHSLTGVFIKLQNESVSIFVLEEDVQRRNPRYMEGVDILTYESFVDQLLSTNISTINL